MNCTVRVIFDDGGQLVTTINTDLAGARAYYIGQTFNFGRTSDILAKGVSVELVEESTT